MTWYVTSIFAAVFLAGHFLTLKKAVLLGVPASVVTFFAWVVSAMGLAVYFLVNRQIVRFPSWQSAMIVLVSSATLMFGALLLNKAVATAPNPGYATAVGSVQVLIVFVASVLLFNADFSVLRALGVLFVVIGVMMLGI